MEDVNDLERFGIRIDAIWTPVLGRLKESIVGGENDYDVHGVAIIPHQPMFRDFGFHTNWHCASNAQVRHQDGFQIQNVAEDDLRLSVLHGGYFQDRVTPFWKYHIANEEEQQWKTDVKNCMKNHFSVLVNSGHIKLDKWTC